MRWQGRKGSDNVDDRRGRGGRRAGRLGIIGTILVVLFALIMGEDPMQLLQQVGGGEATTTTQPTTTAADDELAQFVSVVLKDTEDVWNKVFQEQLGRNYQEPTLVLFRDQDRSACG